LGYLTVRASWNSIFMHQSCIVLSSTLALSFYIALEFSSCVGSAISRFILKIEKNMRGQRMRQKISNREGWASSVKTLGMGQGVMYAGQVVKIERLKVKFECLKVRFEWLKGQRSVQHPEDIRVNEYTPRECTSACKARGFLKVKFECLKVKFEWLRGQRSVQHPEDIRENTSPYFSSFFKIWFLGVHSGRVESTGTRLDYLVNRADKKGEGPLEEKKCTEIEK